MNPYKCWLLKHFELDIDIINIIKLHTRIIKPPTYEELKLGIVNNYYIKNDIVYTSQLPIHVNFYKNLYNYVSTDIYVDVEDGLKAPDIHFSYFVDNTLFDYTFILNYELSFINPNQIYMYWIDKDAHCFYNKDVLDIDNVEEQLDPNPFTFDRKGIYVIVGQVIFIA